MKYTSNAKDFKKELKELLEKHQATISFWYDGDTHGITDEGCNVYFRSKEKTDRGFYIFSDDEKLTDNTSTLHHTTIIESDTPENQTYVIERTISKKSYVAKHTLANGEKTHIPTAIKGNSIKTNPRIKSFNSYEEALEQCGDNETPVPLNSI